MICQDHIPAFHTSGGNAQQRAESVEGAVSGRMTSDGGMKTGNNESNI